jgi:hypothetical protein
MEVPRTVDIASLFLFAAMDGDADAETSKEGSGNKTSTTINSFHLPAASLPVKAGEEEVSKDDILPKTWRDALNQTSVVANSIRHLLQPDVQTAMDRDVSLWIALEEDIISVNSDDTDDLDYGADDDDDDDDVDDSVSLSSGGSSDLSDGDYIVDEPDPFGKMVAGKCNGGKGSSIVDDWTDDDEDAYSDVSNWSDDNGKKKKKTNKKKQPRKGAASAGSSSGNNRKTVLVSSKSGTQKQLSAFGIKMTITNKTGGDGEGSTEKKRKFSARTTATAAADQKKNRRRKKSAPTAAPNGKVRSETDKKPYAVGSSIVLRNLTANDVHELNGKRGVVRSGIRDDGKQEIEVEGQEGLLPMSLHNMRGVCPLFGSK